MLCWLIHRFPLQVLQIKAYIKSFYIWYVYSHNFQMGHTDGNDKKWITSCVNFEIEIKFKISRGLSHGSVSGPSFKTWWNIIFPFWSSKSFLAFLSKDPSFLVFLFRPWVSSPLLSPVRLLTGHALLNTVRPEEHSLTTVGCRILYFDWNFSHSFFTQISYSPRQKPV